MKIISVVGARPQFIKAYAVSNELRKEHDEILVHTGQHYDEEMSDVFFEELDIPRPDHNLGVGSGSHATQTAEMMIGLEELVHRHEPDVMLCYGDTNSTLATGVVGSKEDVTLAHVEAGLRSFNREMPEEVNRVLTDHAADILFAPSERAMNHLESEGIDEYAYNAGDVMYDALLSVREKAVAQSDVLEELNLWDDPYILATVHRPRNTDNSERLETILETLAADERRVILPAHPRTVNRLEQHGLLDAIEEEATLIDPVGYLDFIKLQANADVIVTDSGGIQKEAFFLDVPCVTLREETEWPETVESGGNVLVGANQEAIQDALTNLSHSTSDAEPYGDGNAAREIRGVLEGYDK
ncbi:non-hydrolyzing UDP-N-acetylglucosamine 2-epimerase [Halobacterium salinarum]|uniref:Putative nucleotide sugar epimerase n=1 Tax=Halobacterium salinarum (strain ATCC 33171 / DSM 3754 / JCM 8978 / NBRC 102687 / NCIMB 764 / 91-R6) TaxID=2597657 RepID=A0A4D6GQL7_HALS9|nr:UDP-N-acetylglucosamine 2-epimerase (non-hydrolyzing) [Halobacterium salinarum]QCC44000.1 putative nucleotide sugar epimerase [Halobacterium salinarum]TYO76954.1 UDP-N-acetylglucosamine 2-epimerase (non-hydrolysing) [Halobacterium salinarum DSM 3754]